jgi:hypothetical protein
MTKLMDVSLQMTLIIWVDPEHPYKGGRREAPKKRWRQ